MELSRISRMRLSSKIESRFTRPSPSPVLRPGNSVCVRSVRHHGSSCRSRKVAVRAEQVQETTPPKEETKEDTQGTGQGDTQKSNGNGAVIPEIDRPWPKQRSFAEVVTSKFGDTLQDILLIANRSLQPLPTRSRLRARVGGGVLKQDHEDKRPVLLILGFGWGAHSLSKVVDIEKYNVVVVSRRNHFVFTPMLPSTAVGTVEFRSLLEPVRTSNPFVEYLEADCLELDLERKVARCKSEFAYESGNKPEFEIDYDIVVVAVGEKPATYDVPGVYEHCFFMKEVSDCVALRKRIGERFELSALPGTSEAEIRSNLHFVIVGGGPTGVEFAGTLADFLRVDMNRKYPQLTQYIRVTLLQSAQTILTMFSATLQDYAISAFERTGVSVRTGVKVIGITSDKVKLEGGEELDYGVCLWSCGNSARQLVRDLSQKIPGQAPWRGRPASAKLAVDPYLRIVGARDAFALGDCTNMFGNRLPATAQVAGQQGAYVARVLNNDCLVGVGGLDQLPPIKKGRKPPSREEPGLEQVQNAELELPEGTAEALHLGWFGEASLPGLLAHSSSNGFSQNGTGGASTNGAAAASTNGATLPNGVEGLEFYKPFEFLSLGLMAYIGNDKAVTQLEAGKANLQLWDYPAFLLWRSVYITKQVSFRNRVLILFDWLKARVFGRDISLF